MMLFKIVAGGYVGFYHEYGGRVYISGYRSGKEVYSYEGLSDVFCLVKPLRKKAAVEQNEPRWEIISCRLTGTDVRVEFEVHFVCYTKTIGVNKYVNPRKTL